ncbi:MAG TPA: hypothetical protein PK349_01220 [Candidatus Hydrogenedentes bacterium]|nr:hypothetical protein [Candidatus Hydrogenedentota bacterium]
MFSIAYKEINGRAIVMLVAALIIFGNIPRASAQDLPQVNVSVKIIEFQSTKDSETGLSAYFKQRNEPRPYGRISSGNGNITAASLAFPASTTSGLNLFFDRLSTIYGDIELVLQALVDQNRAFILSQPKVMVPVGAPTPTTIKTSQDVPYENTIVVGASAVQTTAFRPTGVQLDVQALKMVDDDQNPVTTDDIYVLLHLTAAINEEGQRITVALDEKAGQTNTLTRNTMAISVPEFVSRSVDTTVWVRNGQVMILGGLYRNTKSKSVSSLPWLSQAEDVAAGAINKTVPGVEDAQVPLSSLLGNTSRNEGRRELVFMIRVDVWRKSFVVADEFGLFEEGQGEGGEENKTAPSSPPASRDRSATDIITGVLEDLTGATQNLTEPLRKRDRVTPSVTEELGAPKK